MRMRFRRDIVDVYAWHTPPWDDPKLNGGASSADPLTLRTYVCVAFVIDVRIKQSNNACITQHAICTDHALAVATVTICADQSASSLWLQLG